MIKETKLMNKSFLIAGTLAAGSMLFVACGEKKAEAPNPASLPVPVNTYVVTPEKATYYDMYPGTVVAMNQVDIRSQTEGYVTGIFFKDGAHVTKGQKLYQIDVSKYQASVNQSKANIQVAEANLAQAQKDADRYIYLNEHDAVAKQTLDHALTTLQNAKNQLAAAKQDAIKTQTDLNYSVIRAPFDGTIGISQVREGASVAPGTTILNTISTENPMAVDILINEKQIGRFMTLQQSKTNAADSIFTLQLPDNTLYSAVGQVYTIDRGVNPQTGSITVRLTFPNPGGQLRSGMSPKVRVRNTDNQEQIIIPLKAVTEQMGEYFVYVKKDTAIAAPDAADGKKAPAPTVAPHAIQRKVVLGPTIADKVIVKSGLEAGDNLIVDGVQKLHDGSLISLGAKK
jgi:membrane fusion protein (multidrug efflux system)